jgi:hypothetical protein
MLFRPAVQTAREAVPVSCFTCRDGSGWMRWCVGGFWLWAACADCNDPPTKPKPLICPTCSLTAPFCPCLGLR